MALLSPLLLIWADPRILFLFQMLGIAVSGLIHYKILEEKRSASFFGILLMVITAISVGSYFQLGCSAFLGDSFGKISSNILTHPGQVLGFMLARSSFIAL